MAGITKPPIKQKWAVPSEAITLDNLVRVLNDTLPLMTVEDGADVESLGVRQMDFSKAFKVTQIEQGEVLIDLSGAAGKTVFGGVPDLAFDYNAQAMIAAGHVDGEVLVQVDDQTGQGHTLFPVATFEPVLEANIVGGNAVFNLTGNKAATTATEFITPTAGCTVFAVVKRTGSHVETGIWWRFASLASPGAIGNGLHLAESHHFGAAFNQDDKMEIGGAYIAQLDTDWVIVAHRYNDASSVECFVAGVKVPLYNQDATLIGTSINPSSEGDSPRTFTMGNGLFSGLNGKTPRQMGWGRALTDAEITKVADALAVLYKATNTATLTMYDGGGTSAVPYDATKSYPTGRVVTYTGSSWLSLQPTLAVTPAEGVYWTQLGATGASTGVQVGGQIGGTNASPTVLGIRETSGPTLLTTGTVTDGQFLKRVGTALVSAVPPGSGGAPTAAYSYLGYNTIGGSTETATNGRQYLQKITAPSNGIITNIAVYFSAGVQQQLGITVGLVSDVAGAPTKLLAGSAMPIAGIAQPATTPRWVSAPLGCEVAAGDYWLTWTLINSGSKTIYYDTGTDNYITPANSDVRDTGMVADTLNIGSKKYSVRALFLPTA